MIWKKKSQSEEKITSKFKLLINFVIVILFENDFRQSDWKRFTNEIDVTIDMTSNKTQMEQHSEIRQLVKLFL